nr:MAG TPA: hypothetical protein [Microviridae sp.]
MDILLQLQSARRKKTFYACVENIPTNTIMRALNYGHSFTITECEKKEDILRLCREHSYEYYHACTNGITIFIRSVVCLAYHRGKTKR